MHTFIFSYFICLARKLQAAVDFESEELNQYYLAAELMDDVEANSAKMRNELHENPSKFQSKLNNLPQDDYLTDLTVELNQALAACVQQHQVLIEFCSMMDDFFSTFVLCKSFQCTFQICNLLFTYMKVSLILLNLFRQKKMHRSLN